MAQLRRGGRGCASSHVIGRISKIRFVATAAAALLLACSVLPGVALAGAGSMTSPAGATGGRSDDIARAVTAQPAVATAAGTPDTAGSWAAVMDWGLQAKHMVALPTGNVLVWSTGATASLWDPPSSA
jgi:hypothetical protein